MFVPPQEGHDDFLISLALCCEATKEKYVPYVDGRLIRPQPSYPYDRWDWA